MTVLATDTDDAQLRQLVALGLERLGCRVNELIVRSGVLLAGGDPVDDEAVAAALLHSELVVDVHGTLVERSSALDEILDEARVLAIDAHSVTDLDHLVAHPGLSKRVERARSLLADATHVQLSTGGGTHLETGLAGARVVASAGAATAVGEIAHWPAGIVWVHPDLEEVTGTVVAMPGDLVPEADHLIRSPVRLELERGRVVEVLGDSSDGDLIRSHLERADDDAAYDLAGLGVGMNTGRGNSSLDLFDRRRLAIGRGILATGMVSIRLADPDLGLTVVLGGATLLVDDRSMVADGELDGSLAPDIYELAAGT